MSLLSFLILPIMKEGWGLGWYLAERGEVAATREVAAGGGASRSATTSEAELTKEGC